MLHVSDVLQSINFYRSLGLELMDFEGDPSCPGWARKHSEGGDLMFLLAEERMESSNQPFFLYLYTDELEGLREHLLANGGERLRNPSAALHAERRNPCS